MVEKNNNQEREKKKKKKGTLLITTVDTPNPDPKPQTKNHYHGYFNEEKRGVFFFKGTPFPCRKKQYRNIAHNTGRAFSFIIHGISARIRPPFRFKHPHPLDGTRRSLLCLAFMSLEFGS